MYVQNFLDFCFHRHLKHVQFRRRQVFIFANDPLSNVLRGIGFAGGHFFGARPFSPQKEAKPLRNFML